MNGEANTEKIHDLETRLAFQEDMLSALNTRVAEQDEHIAQLQYQLKHMYQKFAQGEASTDPATPPTDERPPHY